MKKLSCKSVEILTTLFRKGTGLLICTTMFLCIGIFFSCNKETATSFDFNEYYSYERTNTVYPSVKQIEMLKSVIPKESFQPAPTITNRDYWDKIAASESGKEYLNNALSLMDKKPEVPITDEIYRRANLEGNRGIYKPRYYNTMERLGNFVLAECIENQGRFLPQITVYLDSIMAMKSWLHPNHDTRDNSVLEGRSMAIDLGARKFGSDLALAEEIFPVKLQPQNLQRIMIK